MLEGPFIGASLFDVALFLRLCYRPRELSTSDLAAMLDSLPPLLVLAHKLDAPLVRESVAAAIKGEGETWHDRPA